MSYSLGYVADRVGVITKSAQIKKLLDNSVQQNDIYENLEDCLGSLREGDILTVYTTAILGRNKMNSTFVTIGVKKGLGVYSVSKERLYECGNDVGIKTLADAWSELDNVTNKHIGEIGKKLGGRKKKNIWKHIDAIRQAKNEGMSLKAIADGYDVSESTIWRMLNFKEGIKELIK